MGALSMIEPAFARRRLPGGARGWRATILHGLRDAIQNWSLWATFSLSPLGGRGQGEGAGVFYPKHSSVGWRAGILGLCLCLGGAVGGQEPPPAKKPASARQASEQALADLLALDPELAKELQLPKFSTWDTSFSLLTGAGYKDNLLLGYHNPQASGFSHLVGEFTLWRLPDRGWQFYAYLLGDDIRYFSSEVVKKEQVLMALAQLKKDFDSGWRWTLGHQYLYFDQVLDVSSSQDLLTPLPVTGHSFSPKTALRRDLARSNWVEIELELMRQSFALPLDDYWEAGPRLTLGRNYGHKSEVSVGYEFNRRFYDTRRATDAGGVEIPGAELTYDLHRLDAVWKHHFDAKRRWQAVTRVIFERNADSGAGYYDYWKYQFGEQLRFHQGRWDLRGQLKWTRYDYRLKKAGPATDALLERALLALEFKAEFEVAKGLKLFAEYQFERSLSNDPLNRYRVNTFGTGLNWEF